MDTQTIITLVEKTVNKILDERLKAVPPNRNFIHSLAGLQQFLQCSQSAAQRIAKNLPKYRDGGIILFDREEVLAHMRENPDCSVKHGRGPDKEKRRVKNG